MERDLETTLSLLNKEIGEKQKVIDQLEVVENEKAHVMQQLEESGRQSGLKEQQLKKELRDTVRDLETDKVKLKMHYVMQLEKERRKKDNDFQSKVQLITNRFLLAVSYSKLSKIREKQSFSMYFFQQDQYKTVGKSITFSDPKR